MEPCQNAYEMMQKLLPNVSCEKDIAVTVRQSETNISHQQIRPTIVIVVLGI